MPEQGFQVAFTMHNPKYAHAIRGMPIHDQNHIC